MKRFLCVLMLISIAGTLRAQESPESELEYVRQLRAKGWTDLARTKIDDLLKRNDPLLNAALPLELARINISAARQMGPEQRFALFTAARGQLQEFISKNQGKAGAALASAELARLTSYHAQALLSRAMREEDNRSRHEKARPAEAMFIQAGKDIEGTAKALETALADPNNASLKSVLNDELRRARLDSATNLFDQAKTYIDTSKDAINLQRSDLTEKARKTFFLMRADESSEVGWLANAWLMKIAMEQTAGDAEVQKYYDSVMKQKDTKAAQPGVRLVRFFHMQDLAPQRPDAEAIGKSIKNSKLKPVERLHGVQKEGETWLRLYSGFLKTPEGQGVLYETGLAYFMEAEELKHEAKTKGTKKDPKKIEPKASADLLYDKAIKHLDELAAMDGDRSEAARQISLSIKFRRLGDKAELKTFDEFLMRAMIERDRVRAVSGNLEGIDPDDKAKQPERKKLQDERKKHLKETIKALNSAMALTTSKTPVAKIDEAQYYLTGAYLANGDPYRGVIVAESLGRNRPPTRRSPEAASIAISTYSAMLSKQPDNASVRQRLNDIASYVLSPEIQVTWKDDPVTSMAHYHLGLSANRENRFKAALDHLAKIKSDFNDYVYTQGQLVFIAEAAREKADKADKKEQQFYIKAARDAIGRMPAFNAKEESGAVVAMYFFAKMEMAKFLYAEAMEDMSAKEELKAVKKCREMSIFVKALVAEFGQVPKNRLTKDHQAQIQFSMFVMLKYGDLGVAEVKFRSDSKDRFDQVIDITKNVVDQTLELAKTKPADQAIEMKDYRVTGDILGLALRSHVQKGNVKQGKAILDVIKRLAGPGAPASTGNVVGVVLSDISGQIQSMKGSKDKDLLETKGHYTAFLDEIAKEYDARGYDNITAMMLGQAFTSLELPAKAAAAYSKVKAPAEIDRKWPKNVPVKGGAKPEDIAKEQVEQEKKQKWEEDLGRYWNVQIEYVRALRATKDAEAQKTAEKTIDALLKHDNGRFKIQAMMERALLLEEQERYREAYLKWSKEIIPNFRDPSDKAVQKLYFTSYFYYARTMFKTGAHDKKLTPATQKKLVEGAAREIIKVEFAAPPKEGWQIVGPLFDGLLKDEPELKKEYDRQKAIRLKT